MPSFDLNVESKIKMSSFRNDKYIWIVGWWHEGSSYSKVEFFVGGGGN